MLSDIDYSKLWKLNLEENQTNELLPLDSDFYKRTLEYIKSIPKDDEVKVNNIKKLLNTLFEKRKQKIIIYAAYKKGLPNSVTSEERDLYLKIVNIINNTNLDNPNTKTIKDNLKDNLKDNTEKPKDENINLNEGESKKDGEQEKESENNLWVMKALIDIPEIVLPSGNKFGPIDKDDVCRASSSEDHEFLLSSDMCVD